MIYWDCFLLFPVSRLLTWSVSQIQTARLVSRASLTPSNLPVPTKRSRWLARTWLIQRAAHRRWLLRIAGRPSLSGHGTLLCLCPAKGVLVWLCCLALDSVVTLPPRDTVPVLCWFLQVLSAATIVAKHTSALCNACRIASSKTANPVAKRHFVQSAKEVANSTANLVKTIKVHMLFNCAFFFLCYFGGFSFLLFSLIELESEQLGISFYLLGYAWFRKVTY